MVRYRARFFLAVALSSASAIYACGSDDETPSTPPPVQNLDASRDSTAKDSTTGSDATNDAAADAIVQDTGADTTTEAATDAGADASDAEADGGVDASDASDAADAADAADANVDAGPIECGDAGTIMLANGSGFSAVSVYSSTSNMFLPGSIVGDGNRRFWIQDPVGNGASGDKLIDMLPSGAVTDRVLGGNAATCTNSQVAMDTAGNGYVFSTGANVIHKVTPAGAVSTFSNVGNIGGGGNCNDTGVIGMLVRGDGTFFLGSPAAGKIFTLSADGVTRSDFANVTVPWRMSHDGQGGLFVVAGAASNRIMAVSSAGVVTERLDAGMGISSVRRDSNGDLYFGSGPRLYRSTAGQTFHEVAACFPGNIADIIFDHPSNDAGAGTSLYVLTHGQNGTTHDSGDRLLEMKR